MALVEIWKVPLVVPKSPNFALPPPTLPISNSSVSVAGTVKVVDPEVKAKICIGNDAPPTELPKTNPPVVDSIMIPLSDSRRSVEVDSLAKRTTDPPAEPSICKPLAFVGPAVMESKLVTRPVLVRESVLGAKVKAATPSKVPMGLLN